MNETERKEAPDRREESGRRRDPVLLVNEAQFRHRATEAEPAEGDGEET